jgi:hypothetical protein
MEILSFRKLVEIQRHGRVLVDGPKAAGGPLEMEGDIRVDAAPLFDGRPGTFPIRLWAKLPLILLQDTDPFFGNFDLDPENLAATEQFVGLCKLL